VSAPGVTRIEAADYSYRAPAAALGCLVLHTMFIVIRWIWLVIGQALGAVQK